MQNVTKRVIMWEGCLIGVRAEDKQVLAWLVYGWNLAIMVFCCGEMVINHLINYVVVKW